MHVWCYLFSIFECILLSWIGLFWWLVRFGRKLFDRLNPLVLEKLLISQFLHFLILLDLEHYFLLILAGGWVGSASDTCIEIAKAFGHCAFISLFSRSVNLRSSRLTTLFLKYWLLFSCPSEEDFLINFTHSSPDQCNHCLLGMSSTKKYLPKHC